MKSLALAAIVCGALLACNRSAPVVPEAPAAAPTGGPVWFEEVAAARGLKFEHRSGHRERFLLPEIMGGGAALFDMEGDGDLDAFLVQSGAITTASRTSGHRLFRNRGNGTFDDITTGSGVDMAGYGMGVAAGDYDNDGDVDLYVTNLERNVLLQNSGGGRFTDATRAAGVGASGWSTSAAFLDYDADGFLDLFVTRYLEWTPQAELPCFSLTGAPDYCSPKNYDAPMADLLFHNTGHGSFRDVSNESGIASAVGNGLGVVTADFDRDGRIDIFVANDGTPNHLWMNRGGGRFANMALLNGVAVDQDGTAKAGMGVHVADADNDHDPDLLVVNLDGESDSFYRNDGAFFADATAAAGLRIASRRFTRFGTAMIDFDNDGLLDLYQANGRVGLQGDRFSADAYAEPNLMFRGDAPGHFVETIPQGGTAAPLIATSRAAAFGDIDNDGGVDILIVNRDAPAHLLRNAVASRGAWMAFRVIDRSGRDALGAELLITAGSQTLFRDVRAAYSYLASNDPRVHVALGREKTVGHVVVRWVDGSLERFGPFDAGRVVTLRQGGGTRATKTP